MYIVLILGEKIAQSMTYKIRSMSLVLKKKKKTLKEENQKNSRNIYQIIGKMYNSGFSI